MLKLPFPHLLEEWINYKPKINKNKMENKGLQPHEVRVVNERLELIEKITKLHAFMASNFYQTIDETTQNDLEEQVKLMMAYSDVLLKRINRFEGTIENTVIELTFGQQAVGLNFNHAEGIINKRVHKAKQLNADLIDLLEEHRNDVTDNGNQVSSWLSNVLRTAAFNAIIAAQMAVVKYLTWRD